MASGNHLALGPISSHRAGLRRVPGESRDTDSCEAYSSQANVKLKNKCVGAVCALKGEQPRQGPGPPEAACVCHRARRQDLAAEASCALTQSRARVSASGTGPARRLPAARLRAAVPNTITCSASVGWEDHGPYHASQHETGPTSTSLLCDRINSKYVFRFHTLATEELPQSGGAGQASSRKGLPSSQFTVQRRTSVAGGQLGHSVGRTQEPGEAPPAAWPSLLPEDHQQPRRWPVRDTGARSLPLPPGRPGLRFCRTAPP